MSRFPTGDSPGKKDTHSHGHLMQGRKETRGKKLQAIMDVVKCLAKRRLIHTFIGGSANHHTRGLKKANTRCIGLTGVT